MFLALVLNLRFFRFQLKLSFLMLNSLKLPCKKTQFSQFMQYLTKLRIYVTQLYFIFFYPITTGKGRYLGGLTSKSVCMFISIWVFCHCVWPKGRDKICKMIFKTFYQMKWYISKNLQLKYENKTNYNINDSMGLKKYNVKQ